MGKSFATSVRIEAPAEKIWGVLTDAPAYASWNTTVDKVDGDLVLGQKVTVHAKISPGRAFPVEVAELDRPTRMVWRSAMPLGAFQGERTFTLTPEHGAVTFTMREAFTGWLSPLIGLSIPDLQPAFDEFAACLKRRSEEH